MADLQDDPNIQFQEASTQQPAEPTSEKELPDSQVTCDLSRAPLAHVMIQDSAAYMQSP